ncbi:MAG: CidA/LrgA family protein, partial [Deinococcota bacterium]
TLTLCLLFQLLGEGLAPLLPLQVPGPVLGMVLLFGVLLFRAFLRAAGSSQTVTEVGLPTWLERGTKYLLSYLALLFVPAGVGIVQYGERVQQEAFGLAIVLIASTLITLLATALTMQAVIRWQRVKSPPSKR